MTPETLKENFTIPSSVHGFWKLVAREFLNNETVRNIETIAQRLVKKEGMEQFASQLEPREAIEDNIKKTLGRKRWKKISEEETKRWLEGDRDVVGAAGG